MNKFVNDYKIFALKMLIINDQQILKLGKERHEALTRKVSSFMIVLLAGLMLAFDMPLWLSVSVILSSAGYAYAAVKGQTISTWFFKKVLGRKD